MSANKVNKTALELLIIVSMLFLLLLTAENINNYLSQKKVLGAETKIDITEQFWRNFLNKNPNYVPGWIEIGDIQKAREIDPNYL